MKLLSLISHLNMGDVRLKLRGNEVYAKRTPGAYENNQIN